MGPSCYDAILMPVTLLILFLADFRYLFLQWTNIHIYHPFPHLKPFSLSFRCHVASRRPDVGRQSLHSRPVILLVLQIVQRRHFWRASTMSSGQTVRSERRETVGQDLRACQRVSDEEMPRLDSKDGVHEE